MKSEGRPGKSDDVPRILKCQKVLPDVGYYKYEYMGEDNLYVVYQVME